MPIVKIDMLKGQSADYKQAVIKSIHTALVDVFKIKQNDQMVRLREYESENFRTIDYMSNKALFVEMIVFPGRTPETKAQLYRTMVNNLKVAPGIDPMDVFIVLLEPPKDNWGIRGGQQASMIDLGFKTDV